MERPYTVSIKLALAVVMAVLAAQAYRAATRPIGTEEAALYDHFVRPTVRQILSSELPDSDVLCSLLEKRSVGLFHVSPFSVRLPSLLFAVLYFVSIWNIGRLKLGNGWSFLALVVAFAAVPQAWGIFSQASGTGAALALLVCAAWLAVERRYLNLIGICIGLSVVARIGFLIPAVLVALAVLALDRRWYTWVDRVAVPAAVVAVIFLALPLSHANASADRLAELSAAQAAHLQSALDALRTSAGPAPVRIAVTPSAEPVVNFYRAQHRAANWSRASRDLASEQFDYYLFPSADRQLLEARHLIVIHEDPDFILARNTAAPM